MLLSRVGRRSQPRAGGVTRVFTSVRAGFAEKAGGDEGKGSGGALDELLRRTKKPETDGRVAEGGSAPGATNRPKMSLASILALGKERASAPEGGKGSSHFMPLAEFQPSVHDKRMAVTLMNGERLGLFEDRELLDYNHEIETYKEDADRVTSLADETDQNVQLIGDNLAEEFKIQKIDEHPVTLASEFQQGRVPVDNTREVTVHDLFWAEMEAWKAPAQFDYRANYDAVKEWSDFHYIYEDLDEDSVEYDMVHQVAVAVSNNPSYDLNQRIWTIEHMKKAVLGEEMPPNTDVPEEVDTGKLDRVRANHAEHQAYLDQLVERMEKMGYNKVSSGRPIKNKHRHQQGHYLPFLPLTDEIKWAQGEPTDTKYKRPAVVEMERIEAERAARRERRNAPKN
eukprot:Clim_evm108s88 gene=Clim_evmTU108s88